MRDVTGRGADGGPVRSDLPLHDLTGGNHFVPDILPEFYPGEVNAAQLQDAQAARRSTCCSWRPRWS